MLKVNQMQHSICDRTEWLKAGGFQVHVSELCVVVI